jgi:hypothetical protein
MGPCSTHDSAKNGHVDVHRAIHLQCLDTAQY